MATLDLSPHGQTLVHLFRGPAGGVVARLTRLAPDDQPRAREDLAQLENMTAEMSMADMRAFIEGQGGIPAIGTTDRPVTHADLATHMINLVMGAWWPEIEEAL